VLVDTILIPIFFHLTFHFLILPLVFFFRPPLCHSSSLFNICLFTHQIMNIYLPIYSHFSANLHIVCPQKSLTLSNFLTEYSFAVKEFPFGFRPTLTGPKQSFDRGRIPLNPISALRRFHCITELDVTVSFALPCVSMIICFIPDSECLRRVGKQT
jgi:hypothetical protein